MNAKAFSLQCERPRSRVLDRSRAEHAQNQK